ncbi:MAG: diaminopimelate decarboxylase [Ignavibacterium sp.]|nr:diaminopimelate decarboxylase [Ignavibacterium sp.]MDW8376108.1 diaminopimelate decarboxylase [Ignavibacteriales bacterium]
MKYFETDQIKYINNELFIENVSLKKLANEYGTPLYVYSRNHFIKQFIDFSNAFKNIRHKIFYAMKANYNLNVINTFIRLGAGVDVNSEGELFRALKAGANPNKIILTGVGKTKNEITVGLKKKLLMIKAESEEELELINKIAFDLKLIAPVALRINPNVDAQTHPYISTGLLENKFGIDTDDALSLYRRKNYYSNIEFIGIDMHIGSQITSVEPFVESVQKMIELYNQLKKEGITIKHLDVGGGIGVKYKDENVSSISDFAEALLPLFQKLDCEIFFEPGRFLTANGGILLTEVLYTKQNNNKNFIIVDAAMNDLLRPTLYQAYHHIQPVIMKNNEIIKADVVGPVCETGDYFAKNRDINKVESGDILAIMSVGAYGMVMSSNYNGRRRPPEIIVDGDQIYLTRSRESFEHLLWDEKVI